MYVVGIDVSKGKSTVCMVSSEGEIVIDPYDINHTRNEMKELINRIKKFKDVKILLEATGRYNYPVVRIMQRNEMFVSIVNPLTMKKFSDISIRKGKTDKKDSLMIARYGLLHWSSLKEIGKLDDVFLELRALSRQYYSYMKMKISAKQNFDGYLDLVMPGIVKLLESEKLLDFMKYFWHFDNIRNVRISTFEKKYNSWAKKNGYHRSAKKVQKIYDLANNSIPSLDSNFASTKLLVKESVKTIRMLETSCNLILTQMEYLARTLPEYNLLINMKGIGVKLAVRFIAEVGDIRKYHSKKALIAMAGLDSPPFESGKFVGTNRHISKRGNKYMRKTGYEIMKSYKTHKPDDDVYRYILKKENEGFPKKKAKIAALNKFVRQYYAKVSELYFY